MSAVLGTASAELYFTLNRDRSRVTLELPEVEDLTFRGLAEELKKQSLSIDALDSLHFDAADSALEVLRLPEVFFQQYLRPTQLTELILNPAMEEVLEGNYLQKSGRSIKARDATKRKIRHIYAQLDSLDPRQLGPQHDAVVARIPTRLYRFLSPATAVLARTCKTTFSALFQLFRLSFRTCVVVGRTTAHALMTAFRALRALGVTPLRVFETLHILLQLLQLAPNLHIMAPRVFELATELEQFTTELIDSMTAVEGAFVKRIDASPTPPMRATRSRTYVNPLCGT